MSQQNPGAEDCDIDPGSAVPTRSFIYKQAGAHALELHLFEPAADAGSRCPAIVFFHGGGWRMGSAAQFFPQCRYLASRGMVALSAQYRLKPQAASVAECVRDARSAMRYVRAHAEELRIDPRRIAAGGGSAGGHLAAATAFENGLDELGEDRAVSCRPGLLVLYNPALFHAMAEQTVALEQFDAHTPPTLMMYGDLDEMTEYGKQVVARSAAEKFAADLHIAAGEKHGFFNHSPWLERTSVLADEFLARHGYTRGAPALKADSSLLHPRCGE